MAKLYLCLSLLLLLEVLTCTEASPTTCSYTSLSGAAPVVSYDAAADKSVEYVDYGSNTNGICLQRARCNKEFATQVLKCSDLRITCENRILFEGEFPACCIKC
ncbi:uncharacterized protein LOC128859288 [Anastrepha ludens]|uniref:uncharacterized protein LOC128859288 n=1 Tax=Anastrepha ludens TaxID=28586 RepID=UPI0023AE813C|nr:uncharacterized protein LOC128859288 [Anastrepha ludens]